MRTRDVTTMAGQCRAMRAEEVALAVEWAAAEGWNPGLQDATAFLACDPAAFLTVEYGGEPVGCISAARYDAGFGFVGFYIVRREWREHGLGLLVWQAGMARLAGCCVGLDGVVAQQANYQRSGFVLNHRTIRFAAERPMLTDATGETIVPVQELGFAEIAAYDRRCFQAPRAAFLRVWVSLPGHVALGCRRDGALAGYCVLRRCRQGSKIGPLFADDARAARALLAAAFAVAAAGPVFLDVPETQDDALALAREAEMTPVFETARMYTAPPPATDTAKVFGVTTFEFG
jgi:Acetyltransferase (GNAT) domain/Acetyltransferase (GNAT) family